VALFLAPNVSVWNSIGLLAILLLGILTMWYIVYLKIVDAVGRKRRDSNPSPFQSWFSLLDYSNRIFFTGRETSFFENMKLIVRPVQYIKIMKGRGQL
jgi:hypothetical protein